MNHGEKWVKCQLSKGLLCKGEGMQGIQVGH
jgi:hypothetical protein